MDPENGAQPYRLGDQIEIVFNGEIYNHDVLRRDLAKKGYVFGNHCDGAILPALYSEYGPDFVSYLDGMFAVAILDRRGPTKLILAVDHLGIKPLYYSWKAAQKQLAFASEIPALICIGRLSPTLWLPGVDEYLTMKVVTGGKTIYKEINVLTPQTMLIVSAGKEPRLQTWNRRKESFPFSRDITKTSKELEELLLSEVSSLLEADVPMATINSGGLDSSLISALAVHCGKQFQAFHLSYSGKWPFDERKFAHEVADKLLMKQHDVLLDPTDFPTLLPAVVRHMGQPFACPNNLSTYALFRGVKEQGFKVVLSGDGADEMFGGYSRLRQLAYNSAEATSYINSLGILTPGQRENLYSKEFLVSLREEESAASRLASQFQAMPGDTPFEKALEFERTVRLPAYHLRRVDHLSMAHAVEVRVPFCQRRILDFARMTPSDLLVDANAVKKVLYAVAHSYLPASVLRRPKQPFTLPVGAMFRKSDALSAFAREVLSAGIVRSIGIFNSDTVDQLFERERTCSTGKAAEALWALMIFHLWADLSVSSAS
jgi:asparagine synthase (glutamine-hydrolysing)